MREAAAAIGCVVSTIRIALKNLKETGESRLIKKRFKVKSIQGLIELRLFLPGTYCEPENCIERENYYLNLLKPKYNILSEAGSNLGFKHSEQTRAKFCLRRHSEETRRKMSESKKGNRNSMKFQSEETRNKISASRKANPSGSSQPSSQKIEVLDLQTNITTRYDSMREASRALNVSPSSVGQYLLRNKKKLPYKGRYVITKIQSSVRFYTYFSLRSLAKSNRPIDRALLKYGFSSFSLEILEYCDEKEILLEREQYYLDNLKPQYNIVETAGSTLGYKHTEESLEKMRNFVLSDEVLARKRLATENATASRRICATPRPRPTSHWFSTPSLKQLNH